jgi:hypothetical protein
MRPMTFTAPPQCWQDSISMPKTRLRRCAQVIAACIGLGVSNYCVTPDYWFIVPSYAALWVGGSWLHRHHSIDLRGIASFAGSVGVAVSLCFFLSNASFYWIGGRVAGRTWDGWLTNMSAWYWPFLRVPLVYIGVAALIHVVVVRRYRLLHQESATPV